MNWVHALYVVVLSGFFSICQPLPLAAQYKLSDNSVISGTVRSGYHTLQRTYRDGAIESWGDFRLRLQLAFDARMTDAVGFRIRYAGRFSTDQSVTQFIITDHVPLTDGLRLGQSTFDELYLKIQPTQHFILRLGRMQTKFELEGVAKKSLDRNDSPNTDITWTDGAHVRYSFDGGWDAHVVLQYNSKNGGTNVMRYPLGVDSGKNRLSYFTGIESATRFGPIVQRGVHLTYIPASLGGDDYIAVTVKSAAKFTLLTGGPDLLLAGEFGYAPNTPPKTLMRTGENGKSGGIASQISVNLMNVFRRHDIGILIGRIDEGWLISPDLRNNNSEIEIRYVGKITRKLSFQGRFRHRQDKLQLTGVTRKQIDKDWYFRFTYRI